MPSAVPQERALSGLERAALAHRHRPPHGRRAPQRPTHHPGASMNRRSTAYVVRATPSPPLLPPRSKALRPRSRKPQACPPQPPTIGGPNARTANSDSSVARGSKAGSYGPGAPTALYRSSPQRKPNERPTRCPARATTLAASSVGACRETMALRAALALVEQGSRRSIGQTGHHLRCRPLGAGRSVAPMNAHVCRPTEKTRCE